MDTERRISWAAPTSTAMWGLLMWGLAQANFQWPLILVYTSITIGAVGFLLTAAVWCHIGWTWIRSRGLQLGPAVVITVGLAITLGGALWGAFTWKPTAAPLSPAIANVGPRPALFEAQLQELRELDAFIGKKDEIALRETFDFEKIARFNALKVKRSMFPGSVDQAAMIKAEAYFKGGLFIITSKYNHDDGHGGFRENPGAVGGIKVSPKYEAAIKRLESFEMSSTVPTDVKVALKELHDTIDDDCMVLLDVLNEHVSGNKTAVRYAFDPVSAHAAILPNAYWHRFIKLRPKAERVSVAIRAYLEVK